MFGCIIAEANDAKREGRAPTSTNVLAAFGKTKWAKQLTPQQSQELFDIIFSIYAQKSGAPAEYRPSPN